MLLYIKLDAHIVFVDADFDGEELLYTTCKENMNSAAWQVFTESSSREISAAVWAAVDQSRKESKAP